MLILCHHSPQSYNFVAAVTGKGSQNYYGTDSVSCNIVTHSRLMIHSRVAEADSGVSDIYAYHILAFPLLYKAH